MAQIWQQNSALRSRYAQPTLMPTARAVNTRVACEQLEQMARRLEAAQAEIRRYQTRLFACERQMIALRRENAELEAAGEQARTEAEQAAAREQALLQQLQAAEQEATQPAPPEVLSAPETPAAQPEPVQAEDAPPEPQAAAQPTASAAPAEEPTRIMGAAQEEATRIIPPRPEVRSAPSFAPAAPEATRVMSSAPEQEATRVLPRQPEPVRPAAFASDESAEKYGTRVMPSAHIAPPSRVQAQPLDEEDDYEEEDARDSIAETLIRWVPPITAIVCAGIALWGFVYSQFVM